MVLDPATNLAATELTASVSDAATTFAVTDASVFPDAGSEGAFNLLVWDSEANVNPVDAPDAEFIRVTATDTTADELTVQRGQENTAAAAHPSGATVTDTWSAKDRDDIDTAFAGKADTDANVESFATSGGDGTVPTSQGNGTLSMESVGVDDPGNVLGGSTSNAESTAVGPSASVNSGDESLAAVSGTVSGFFSIAMGRGTEATANDALAFGYEATAASNFTVALGKNADASNENEGVLGSSGQYAPNNWIVPGDFTVQGSKNFEISDPARPETHDLRHGNYEGDVAGGLIYRRTVTIQTAGETGTATVTMPDWFGPLATDVDVVCQAQGHFGDAYAERTEPTGTEITVTANASGEYRLIIFATRDDQNVPNPEDHDVTKPKGVGWDGNPRAYYRDAPGVDVSQFADVERVEQFFDHSEDCDPTPCATAFDNWRVTFSDGERVEVAEPMNADAQTVIDSAHDQREA